MIVGFELISHRIVSLTGIRICRHDALFLKRSYYISYTNCRIVFITISLILNILILSERLIPGSKISHGSLFVVICYLHKTKIRRSCNSVIKIHEGVGCCQRPVHRTKWQHSNHATCDNSCKYFGRASFYNFLIKILLNI